MQIKWPGTAHDLGFTKISELSDPCRNIDAGAKYLGKMLKLHKGNCHMALSAYNQGPTRINGQVQARELPDEAVKYSDYIYHHLQFVMSDKDTDKIK